MSCLEFANPENVDALLRYSPKDLISLCPEDMTETANNDPIRNKLAYMKEVHSYLKELKRNNYQLPREYNYSKNLKTEGRLFVEGFGIQKLWKPFRDFILPKTATDYDMVNAHPSILLSMCKESGNGLTTTYLESYINNREDILKKYNLTKKQILKTINCDRITTTNRWLKNFHDEIKDIQKHYWEKYPEHQEDKTNKRGSLLNKLLCINENRFLQEACNGLDVMVYMFDGFISCSVECYLEELNAKTQEAGIRWEKKSIDSTLNIDYQFESLEPQLLNYEDYKPIFEENNCIVKEPFSHYRKGIDGWYALTLADFRGLYQNCWVTHCEWNGKTKKMEEKEKRFIDIWLDDANRLTYQIANNYLPPMVCPPNALNLFTGFKLDYNSDFNPNKQGLQKILNHIKFLCGDDNTEAVYDWMEQWIAHRIHLPGRIPKCSIVIKTPEGYGKGLLFQMLENIFGQSFCMSTADSEYLFGKFNMRDGKVLIALNEASGKDTFMNSDKFKEMITDPTFAWQAKGSKPLTLNNVAGYFIFTNNDIPVKVPENERRFMVVDLHRGIEKPSSEYFNELWELINDRDVLLTFINHLKLILNKNFDFAKERPKTEYYKALTKSVACYNTEFIVYLLSKHYKEEYTAKELHLIYKNYMEGRDLKPLNACLLGMKLKGYKGIENVRITKGPDKGCKKYVLDWKVLLNEIQTLIEDDEYCYINKKRAYSSSDISQDSEVDELDK